MDRLDYPLDDVPVSLERDVDGLLRDSQVPVLVTDSVAEFDRALADIRRANSRNVTVSLEELEAEFAAIQALLDASGDRGEQLRDAFQARRDFAAGRVRRE